MEKADKLIAIIVKIASLFIIAGALLSITHILNGDLWIQIGLWTFFILGYYYEKRVKSLKKEIDELKAKSNTGNKIAD